ncbi:MAG: type II secretion system protein M [Turneriella sp.]|nr:type II secretion system protein M [Turneriella sp.]
MRRFWDSLSPRERIYLMVLAVFLVLVATFFTARSFTRYMRDLNERSNSAERDTMQIEQLGRQYQMLQAMRTGDSQQLDNMLSNIETMLRNTGLRDKIGSLTPTDTVVQDKYLKREVKLTIRESPANLVLDFIRQVEQSVQILYKIENFSFRPVLKKPGIYDFTLQISAFQKKQ